MWCDAFIFVPIGGGYNGEETEGTVEEKGLDYALVEQQRKAGCNFMKVLSVLSTAVC